MTWSTSTNVNEKQDNFGSVEGYYKMLKTDAEKKGEQWQAARKLREYYQTLTARAKSEYSSDPNNIEKKNKYLTMEKYFSNADIDAEIYGSSYNDMNEYANKIKQISIFSQSNYFQS